jgi:hypothetical protein
MVVLVGVISLNKFCLAQDDTIFNSITTFQLVSILEAEGYTAEDKGDNIIELKLKNDSDAFVKISDKNDNVIFAFFDAEIETSEEKVNKWNQTKSYSKAFFDKDQDVWLELDLSLNGGVTKTNIINFFDLCVISQSSFVNSLPIS